MSFAAIQWVLEHSEAGGSERLLLLVIAHHANEQGEAWPGIQRLARSTRKDARWVKRLLRRLEASGELQIVQGGGAGRPNTYRLPAVADRSTSGASNSGGMGQNKGQSVHNGGGSIPATVANRPPDLTDDLPLELTEKDQELKGEARSARAPSPKAKTAGRTGKPSRAALGAATYLRDRLTEDGAPSFPSDWLPRSAAVADRMLKAPGMTPEKLQRLIDRVLTHPYYGPQVDSMATIERAAPAVGRQGRARQAPARPALEFV